MRRSVLILLFCILAAGLYSILSDSRKHEAGPVTTEPESVPLQTADASGTGDLRSDDVPAKGSLPGAMPGGTDEPWKVVEPEPETVRPQYDPTQPLTRTVVFVQPCSVQIRNGSFKVPAGVRARLVQDRGDSADVQIGGTTVNVPRMAVAGTNSPRSTEPERPVAAPAGISGFFERIFQPLPNSLGMDVKEIGTGKGIDRKWQASWGSYERDFYQTKGLQVDVRNVSRSGSGQCQAEVYWFARQLADNKLVIHHREVIPLEVGPITSVSRRFWSPLAASGVDKYVLLGKTNVAGVKLDGWAVAITRDGKILAGRGSGPEQDQIARSEPRLGTLNASYTPTGQTATDGMRNWRKDPIRQQWGSRGRNYQDQSNPNPEPQRP